MTFRDRTRAKLAGFRTLFWYLLPIATLSGCGSIPYDTASLVPPAKRCLVSPARLPKLKEGDDLVQTYASVTRHYGREVSKQRCLQRWARTVLAK